MDHPKGHFYNKPVDSIHTLSFLIGKQNYQLLYNAMVYVPMYIICDIPTYVMNLVIFELFLFTGSLTKSNNLLGTILSLDYI